MSNYFMKLWNISRPHVLKGTILSFTAFSLIEWSFMTQVSPSQRWSVVFDNFIVFMYYVFGNLAIQCQNQLTDEQSDRVNKPYLPLPSKQVTREELRIISIINYSLYGAMTVFYFGIFTTHGQYGIIAIILSSFYSLPPFNLKQIPFINSAVIIICRAICYHSLLMKSFLARMIALNASGQSSLGTVRYADCLNAFFYMQCWNIIMVCLYKDVPDIEGDSKIDNITTIAILLGKHPLYWAVIVSGFISIYVANMKPMILNVVLLLIFVPYYSYQHWKNEQYGKAYLHIWNFFYLNLACFVIYACVFF